MHHRGRLLPFPASKPRLLLATTIGTYELQLTAERPDVRISSNGNNVVLTWTNAAFSLQAGPSPAGPFTNVPGATSPYTAPKSGNQRFFRLAR